MSMKTTVTLEGQSGTLYTVIIQSDSGYVSMSDLLEAGADWYLADGDMIGVEVEAES